MVSVLGDVKKWSSRLAANVVDKKEKLPLYSSWSFPIGGLSNSVVSPSFRVSTTHHITTQYKSMSPSISFSINTEGTSIEDYAVGHFEHVLGVGTAGEPHKGKSLMGPRDTVPRQSHAGDGRQL